MIAVHNDVAANAIGVVDVAYHLPGDRIDIVDYAARSNVDAALLAALLDNGVRYFHDGTDRSDLDLIGAAIETICGRRGREWLGDVAYVIHARTQTFSMPAPPESIITQVCNRFAIPAKLGFGVEQLACAGIVKAIEWARRLLEADPDARHALVITSDRVFGGAPYRIRQDAGIQSDGGSAILLGRDGLISMLGTITSKTFDGLHEGPTTPENIDRIGRYTWHQTKRAFLDHAIASGCRIDDIDLFLPVNADRDYWTLIAGALRIPAERFFTGNIAERGHACCADLAVNLVDRGLDVVARGGSVIYCGQSNLGVYANITFLPVANPANRRGAESIREMAL